jgi:hypothetical protein
MSKAKANLQQVVCPNCGHTFTAVSFYKKKQLDKKKVFGLLDKYKKYEVEIEDVVTLVAISDGKEDPDPIDLQRILEFINEETGGLFRFLKARRQYKEKRIYLQENKGINYFLGICKNTKLEGAQDGYLPRENYKGVKPPGREV